MNIPRRTFMHRVAGSLMAAPAMVPFPGLSGKKGWGGGDAARHRLFGAHWYYTWSPKTRPSNEAEFVPMMKGAWSLKQADAVRAMSGISHLLGFNEPEREKQGNLSVDEAVKNWPTLVELAEQNKLRLGSPAPSSDRKGMEWLEAFMEQVKRQGLRVDFMAVHWYRGTDAGDFQKFIRNLARSYRRPIWVTEFNGWSGTESRHFTFLRSALRFLEGSDDVERYAYFEPGKGKPHSLLAADGSLTRMGELYRDAG